MLVAYQSRCRCLLPKSQAQHLFPGLIFKRIDHTFHTVPVLPRKLSYGAVRELIPHESWMPPFTQDFSIKQGKIITTLEGPSLLETIDPEERCRGTEDVTQPEIVRCYKKTLRNRLQPPEVFGFNRDRSKASYCFSMFGKKIFQSSHISVSQFARRCKTGRLDPCKQEDLRSFTDQTRFTFTRFWKNQPGKKHPPDVDRDDIQHG